jgi:hypothetical protein
MDGLLTATVAWLPCTLVPVLFVLLAPQTGPRGRASFAALMGLLAVASLVVAAIQCGEARQLDVINPFMNPDKVPVPFVVEIVRAPGWQWPIVAAGFLALAAVPLFLMRRRPPAVPCPVVFGSLVTVWTFAARLALEKSAAPEALTWAIGVSVPMMILLPFVGWWSGASRFSFGKFALLLLLLGLVQRSLIVAASYFATTQGLGTHLDVSAIQEVTLPTGHKDFTGPGDQTFAQWISLMVLPQYVLWIPFTMVFGLVVGAPLFVVAKRRAGLSSPSPEGQP